MFTLNQLNTFKIVAELGSFNKAAEALYIAPNAVMKQVNNLEQEVGSKLFNRSYRGQKLTQAGELLYENARYILNYCDDTLSAIKTMTEQGANVIRIGSSPTAPVEMFDTLWTKIRKRYPDIKVEITTFDLNFKDESNSMTTGLGTDFDIMISTFDETILSAKRFNGMELVRVRPCATMSINHPLAEREELTFEDLYNQKLYMLKEGNSAFIDEIREHIRTNHSQIKLEDFVFYNMDLYNQIANSNDIMLGTGDMYRIHPLIKRVPIHYDKTSPFGVLYSNAQTPAVERFVGIIKELWIEEHGSLGYTV